MLKRKLQYSTPIFVENSKLLRYLSFFSPINITAITLGPVVLSGGEMSKETKNHETIHWQQYIETGIIGFLILYLIYWIIGLIKYKSGSIAYHRIPFEQEAYENQENSYYFIVRKRYNWRKRKI